MSNFLSTYKNTSCKIILKVNIINNNDVRIQLVYVDNRFVLGENTTWNESKYYIDKNGFQIWSFGDFYFDERELRIPQYNKMNNNIIHYHSFNNEESQHKNLKRLWTALINWSRSNFFNDDIDNQILTFKTEGEFWLIGKKEDTNDVIGIS